MPTQWIDFRELRTKLRFADVLRHYNVDAKVKGERAHALCPLPSHPARADGKRRTASLSIHLTRGIFQCFGCKASGNAVEFAARMEGFDPTDAAQFRQAAIRIADLFGINADASAGSPVPRGQTTTTTLPASTSTRAAEPPTPIGPSLPIIVNAPLDFELKHLDPNHPYLAERGFTPTTVAAFGLGFCSKGMMRDRIAIPLHDADGRLVGYAGRLVDDMQVSDERPKYLFPGPRERDGKRYEFHKSELLYGAHRVRGTVDDLIVVEGFASVWWLHQHGWDNAVALMGSSMSDAQANLAVGLLAPTGRAWVFGDGDPAGDQCARDALAKIAPQRFVRWIRSAGRQPSGLSSVELAGLLPPT